MDPLGKLSHLGIAAETEFGTAVAATDYLKFSSESLSLKIEDIVEASLQGNQDEPTSLEGLGTIDGNTVHEVHPVGLGYFMRSWFGQPLTKEQRKFVVSATNKYLDFNIGATELIATITEGTYAIGSSQTDAESLCKAIYDAIVAAEAVGTYTVTFNATTKKITIAKSAGTFEILFKTGTHGSDGLNTSCVSLLGYTAGADKTGEITYTSDTALVPVYQHAYTPVVHTIPAVRKGTATAGSTTSLTLGTASWTVNQWAGWWLHIVEGTGADQWLSITSNTATVLSFATAIAPSTDSVFEIIPGPKNCLLPPYTLEVNRNIPGSAAAFQFKGLVANTLAFSFGVGSRILTLTAGWLGKDVANIAQTSPTMPTTEPFKWSQAKIGVGTYDSGTATGGAAATIIDTAGGWVTDALIGMLILKTNAAGTETEVRPITDNDATTITVSPAWTEAAVATDTYEIFYCPDSLESLEFTLDNGLAALPTLSYSKRINRIVGDSFRTGNMTCSLIPQSKTDFDTYYNGWTSRRWLVWFKGQQIAGNDYHEAFFLFPKVLMTAYPVNVGGGGRILVSVAAKLKYDSTAGYLVKGWLNTTRTSYAS